MKATANNTNKKDLKPCPRTLCPVATTLELISGKWKGFCTIFLPATNDSANLRH